MGGKNRIVVDYGDREDLILLARIETKTGDELKYDDLVKTYSKYFSIVKKLDIKINNINDLKKFEESNKEGYVIKFSNGFRVKVKFKEYVRLHGLISNVSNLTIWEHLKKGYNFDLLFERVPDEFYDWLKNTIDRLQYSFNNIERLALKEFIRIYHINSITNRIKFAEEACKSEYMSILYSLYDKKPYNDIIWDMIRPVYGKPFKDGLEIEESEFNFK